MGPFDTEKIFMWKKKNRNFSKFEEKTKENIKIKTANTPFRITDCLDVTPSSRGRLFESRLT